MQKRTNEPIKIPYKSGCSSFATFHYYYYSIRHYFVSFFDCFSLTIPTKMILLFVVPMFVGCCAILWLYWDHFKKPPKKKIFISADCWLCVFDLLPPSQLGQGISMISHRFDFYVDEHFKTRKWTLGEIRIRRKNGENGTKGMEIANYDGKPMPIPKIQLPRKVIGFKHFTISYIDQNAIAFLHRFRRLFDVCPIHLAINTNNGRIAQFLLRDIWPMFGKNFHGIGLSATVLRRFRQFVDPSMLNNVPLLRFVRLYTVNLFGEFPCDDSAAASDGQAVTNWLFTPRSDDVPKVLKCWLDTDDGNWTTRIEAIKAAFASASSPVSFIVLFWIPLPFAASVLLFNRTNELTREQLALKLTDFSNRFLLIRCPIARDESKWTKWEKEATDWAINESWNQKNEIFIQITKEEEIGDGLLDANPGPSDQQQK